jgi:6-phosphogluconolactonase
MVHIRSLRHGGLAVALGLLLSFAIVAPAHAATPAGHVYVQTNSATGNAIAIFDRGTDGTLTFDENVATGGLGIAPTGLGSQGSVAITQDERYLLAVNGGSDDVSLFAVTAGGLRLLDVEAVGDRPVSVAVYERTAYVLNQGGDSIEGLRITGGGLVAIPHSTAPLSGTGVAGAQVAFSPDGRILAVTEKNTQTIDTYVVKANGRPTGPNVQQSSGATPFGFQFGPDGRLYVSEAPASAASSYDVAADGTIHVISATVPNHQGAACWLVVTTDGRFAYTANAATANVSQYTISASGELSLEGTGANGSTAPGPVDLDLTDGDGYLYDLSSGAGAITGFSVSATDGSLTGVGGVTGLPAGSAGLIAT